MAQVLTFFPGWKCLDCNIIAETAKIGISEEKEIMITWQCEGCGEIILISVAWPEFEAMAPKKDQKLLPAKKEEITEQEITWLKEAHILWPEN